MINGIQDTAKLVNSMQDKDRIVNDTNYAKSSWKHSWYFLNNNEWYPGYGKSENSIYHAHHMLTSI